MRNTIMILTWINITNYLRSVKIVCTNKVKNADKNPMEILRKACTSFINAARFCWPSRLTGNLVK